MQLNVFVLYGHPGYLWSSTITNSHIWSWFLQALQGPTHFQKLSHLCVGVENLDFFVANWAVFASSLVILYCDRSMLKPDKSDLIKKGKLCCTLVSRLLFLTWFQWSINFIATKQWNQRLWININFNPFCRVLLFESSCMRAIHHSDCRFTWWSVHTASYLWELFEISVGEAFYFPKPILLVYGVIGLMSYSDFPE